MIQRTDEIGRIVMRLHWKADVFEKIDDFFRVSEIGRLAVANKKESIEHVEDLLRRLARDSHKAHFFSLPDIPHLNDYKNTQKK